MRQDAAKHFYTTDDELGAFMAEIDAIRKGSTSTAIVQHVASSRQAPTARTARFVIPEGVGRQHKLSQGATFGTIPSTKWAACAAIRPPAQLGHSPRGLCS